MSLLDINLQFLFSVLIYVVNIFLGMIIFFLIINMLIDMFRWTLYLAGRILKERYTNWLFFMRFILSIGILAILGGIFYWFYTLELSSPYYNLLQPEKGVIISIVLASLIYLYGYFEARRIRLEKITIRTNKLPEEVKNLRIVQLSDLHLGILVRGKKLAKILNAVEKLAPDIIVSTGDLIEDQSKNAKNLATKLKKVRPQYGKFAVLGNHEYYPGIENSLQFTEDAGFIILRNEKIKLAGLINIVGLDDEIAKYFGHKSKHDTKELFQDLLPENFTLLLKHKPKIAKELINLFDLQLSGHNHKGQIFPFNIITRLRSPLHAGLYSLSEQSSIYVSRGAGTWGLPVRLLAPPEVTLIELVNVKV